MLQREAIGDVRSGFIAVKRVMDKDNLEPQVHGKKACMTIGLRRDGHS